MFLCKPFIKNNFDSKSCLILDLDGVVYQGEQALPGAIEAIAQLKKHGYTIAFLTNNSSKNNASVAAKLVRLGVDCQPCDVMTSGEAALDFILANKVDQGLGAWMIGSQEIKYLAQSKGLRLAKADSCGVIFVGMDLNMNYETVSTILPSVLNGIPVVICNRDAYYPGPNGIPLPGCGVIVGAIEGASQQKAQYEIGKPNPWILENLLKNIKQPLKKCIMIGDSLDSDILMAHKAGIPKIWIASQIDRQNHAKKASELKPDLVLDSLDQILNFL